MQMAGEWAGSAVRDVMEEEMWMWMWMKEKRLDLRMTAEYDVRSTTDFDTQQACSVWTWSRATQHHTFLLGS